MSAASRTVGRYVAETLALRAVIPSCVVMIAARKARTARLSVALAALLAAGCAVGPDFRKPPPPAVSVYTASPLQATAAAGHVAGGERQRFSPGADIPADWWTLFHSRPLNDLIAGALVRNPDLKAAQAALAAAHESVLAERGVYYPSVTAGASALRASQSTSLAPVPFATIFTYNVFTPQVSVAYVADVFGLNRRTVESAQAQADSVRYQMIATYNTLVANVVVAAIQDAAVETQIEATRQLIDLNTRSLRILEYQFQKGYTSKLDVAAQQSQLAQVSATLPPLLKQSGQLHDLLATLAGRFPSQASPKPLDLASLELPRKLPVSLPSDLVAQRPDVLQAEANLHAASARIGIAIANRLPSITLTANAGSSALALDQLFTSATNFWGVGADITAPIFQGGALLHAERSAKAAYRETAEEYRSTVLTAFQNVADTLTALEQDAAGLKAAATAADAARTTLDLAHRQWQDGYAAYLTLLAAEQAYQQARIALVQAQANRFADTAALFQALGGGWWHRPDLTADHHGR